MEQEVVNYIYEAVMLKMEEAGRQAWDEAVDILRAKGVEPTEETVQEAISTYINGLLVGVAIALGRTLHIQSSSIPLDQPVIAARMGTTIVSAVERTMKALEHATTH